MAERARSHGLDAVRGVAISLVLVWHLIHPAVNENYPDAAWALSLFWSGVDLFFVLSGFLIGAILIDYREAGNFFSTFYARRALRIVPAYLILLGLFSWTFTDSLFPYVTFTQNFVAASNGSWGPEWLAPTWSLAVEEQFYLVLPLIIFVCPPRKLPYVLTILILISPACRLAIWTVYDNRWAPYVLLPGRMDSLFSGVLAAWLVRNEQCRQWIVQHRALLYTTAGILFCVILLLSRFKSTWFGTVMYVGGFSTIAAFYFLVVLLTATARSEMPKLLKPLSWMGIGAYSLYLFHMPVFRTISEYNTYQALPISFFVLVILATGFWYLIEKPAISFAKAKFKYTDRLERLAIEGRTSGQT